MAAIVPGHMPRAHGYAAALSAVASPARRPSDIRAMLGVQLPTVSGLSLQQARRGETLVRQALDELEFVLMRNVDVEQAVHVLSGRPAFKARTADDAITAIERRVGTYGAGRQAGRTAYAAARFSTWVPVPGYGRKRLQLDPGEQKFGPVSLLLNPATTGGRATFTPADTLALGPKSAHWASERPRPIEHLPHTLLTWLAQPSNASNRAVRSLARHIDGDDASAVHWISSKLTDSWLGKSLIEMQIRGGIRLADVLGVRVNAERLSTEELARVTHYAQRAGLPVELWSRPRLT